VAPRSSIELDPRLKQAADDAIRRGSTIDEIVEVLQGVGGDVSRSAVGRYAYKTRATMAKLQEAREVAKVWADKFGAEPEGDVGQLVGQVLHAVAFSQAQQMAEAEADSEGHGPREVMFLAGALKNIASANKLSAERILRVRKETAAKAADEVDKVGKQRGLSAEAVAEIKAKILGVAA
jgi:hypothetical protein